MNQPIEVFVSRDVELFSFQKVEGDVYEITRDGKLAYGLISYDQGILYMKRLRSLYGSYNKIMEKDNKN